MSGDDDELLRILFDKRAARAGGDSSNALPVRPSYSHLPMVSEDEDADVMEEEKTEDTPPTLIASDTMPRPAARDLLRVLMEPAAPVDRIPLPPLPASPSTMPAPTPVPQPSLPPALAMEAPPPPVSSHQPTPPANRPPDAAGALPPLRSLRNHVPVEAPPPSTVLSDNAMPAPVGLLVVVLAVIAIALAVAGGPPG